MYHFLARKDRFYYIGDSLSDCERPLLTFILQGLVGVVKNVSMKDTANIISNITLVSKLAEGGEWRKRSNK
mgnify:CR=1 FL=1